MFLWQLSSYSASLHAQIPVSLVCQGQGYKLGQATIEEAGTETSHTEDTLVMWSVGHGSLLWGKECSVWEPR